MLKSCFMLKLSSPLKENAGAITHQFAHPAATSTCSPCCDGNLARIK